jgi:hypothetical protein
VAWPHGDHCACSVGDPCAHTEGRPKITHIVSRRMGRSTMYNRE